MTAEAEGRPQDQGRSRTRRGRPSAETTLLLTSWQATLRAELRAIVAALDARAPAGLLPADAPDPLIPLDDPKRDRLVDRGVKVARELGASIDDAPEDGPTPTPATTPAKRRRKIDFGGE